MTAMLSWLEQLPLSLIIIACLTLGLAPFFPEPHIWEKLKMVANGTLSRPIDVFDLAMHGLPFLVLAAKLGAMALRSAT
jgi:hypothetical protein